VTDIESPARTWSGQPGSPQADEGFLREALGLAERGLGRCPPNPMVGAVIVQGGRVVGRGWHLGPGTPHAETVAIAEAGDLAAGSTLYVTLEPCTHTGRTPPCVAAVLRARVGRVVSGMMDPNPAVDGGGFDALRAAGVRVEVGLMVRACADLVAGFAKHVRTGLPYVTLKTAATLDGKTAARDGSSRWISGDEARREVHRLPARGCPAVAGAGTSAADDPSLTVRREG